MQNITEYIKALFTHQGRLRRLEYILLQFVVFGGILAGFFLFAILPTILLSETEIIFFLLKKNITILILITSLLLGIYLLLSCTGWFFLVVQRLHDLNKSGKILFFILIPIFNLFYSFYLICICFFQKGVEYKNNYIKQRNPQIVLRYLLVFLLIIPIGFNVLGIYIYKKAWKESKKEMIHKIQQSHQAIKTEKKIFIKAPLNKKTSAAIVKLDNLEHDLKKVYYYQKKYRKMPKNLIQLIIFLSHYSFLEDTHNFLEKKSVHHTNQITVPLYPQFFSKENIKLFIHETNKN